MYLRIGKVMLVCHLKLISCFGVGPKRKLVNKKQDYSMHWSKSVTVPHRSSALFCSS